MLTSMLGILNRKGVLTTALALVALAALAWRERVRRPWIGVGYAWFLGMLVPVIGIVQVGRQGWADRYSQLPSIGVLVAVVWTVHAWCASSVVRQRIAAVAALMLCGMEFSIIAMIGVVLLIGIVKKNAIMMIDFALAAERQQGKSPREAIREAENATTRIGTTKRSFPLATMTGAK